jgi:hypothetical protein
MLSMRQTLSYSLYNAGNKNIQNVDFSESVIEKMASKYSNCTEMSWEVRYFIPFGLYIPICIDFDVS